MLTDRGRFALLLLTDYDWLGAAGLREAEWAEAGRLNDEEAKRRLIRQRNALSQGAVLAWLHRQGYAERTWHDYSSTWTYTITPLGRRTLKELGFR